MDRAEKGPCWCVYPATNEELCSGTDWDRPKMISSELFHLSFNSPNTSHSMVSFWTAQNEDVYDVFRVWGPADLVCFSVPLWLRLPVRHARGPEKNHLTDRRWKISTRWCEDSKNFSRCCVAKLAPSMHQAVSWLTIDTSSVRPIFSAAEIVSFVWTAYLSFARGANKWADAGWGCLLECLPNPIIHHFLMAKLSRNSLKI